jgi:hypothetical protein
MVGQILPASWERIQTRMYGSFNTETRTLGNTPPVVNHLEQALQNNDVHDQTGG